MAKFKLVEYKHDGVVHLRQYHYMCPGCNYIHAIRIKADGGVHNFNMDLNNPTVSPSVLQDFVPDQKCHSYINNGMIQFLSDCDHSLAGQTVELPEII